MIEDRRLDVFELLPGLPLSHASNMKLPSWVPDYPRPALVTPCKRTPLAPDSSTLGWGANNRNMYRWEHRIESDFLYAHGMIVDALATDLAAVDALTVGAQMLTLLLNKATKAWQARGEVYTENPKPNQESLRLALLADFHVFDGRSCEKAEQAYARVTKPYDPRNETQRHDFKAREQAEREKDNVGKIRIAMQGRRLWFTTCGRFASGSSLAEDDIVCVLHGASNRWPSDRLPEAPTL
ncbi:hypothetical protein EK21DRAFT_118785 [Setomelanomma holmii]|uniref:Uncharacterized protein n=1 Tax=Setomelanomma holmii TaxID=210430 RepID=A0A9P4LGQ1_9PLEO|nr:hypothetical protein EK21DRAFT_118785 [Setomelanomma holmii]